MELDFSVLIPTAVLEKKQGINLIDHDIFLNIAGGIRIDEPALDLGVAAALLSSYLERPIDAHTVVCGEIGLAGEVRAVGHMEQRLKEAARLGFTRFLLPVAAWRQVQEQKKPVRGMALVAIANVGELAEALFAAEQYKQTGSGLMKMCIKSCFRWCNKKTTLSSPRMWIISSSGLDLTYSVCSIPRETTACFRA